MFEASSDLSSYLAPNERVLWQGQGTRRSNDAWMGVGVIVILVVSALIYSVFFQVPGWWLPLIPVAVGVGIVILMLVRGRRPTRNIRYFVTTASAILIYPLTAWSSKRVTILPLKNLQQVTMRENSDGTGTLIFVQSAQADYGGRYSNYGWAYSTPAFSNIERPQEVYQLIRKTMKDQ